MCFFSEVVSPTVNTAALIRLLLLLLFLDDVLSVFIMLFTIVAATPLLLEASVDTGSESRPLLPWRLAECMSTGWRTFWGGGTWNMVYGVPPDEIPHKFCDIWLDTEWMCWCVAPVIVPSGLLLLLVSCMERLAWGTSVDMRA